MSLTCDPGTRLYASRLTAHDSSSSKSLPLPPFLLTHRNACVKEGVECSNALLGDKASWIPGIVDEVTFNAKEQRIIVVLIDGSTMVLPIDAGCRSVLDGVVAQVQLTFAAQQQGSTPASHSRGPSRSGSSSSTSSSGSSSSGLRSPSALLSALLSPIMNNVASASKPAPPPLNLARVHRRQARSLLVDAFRQYVLTALKEVLPSSFMMWSLQGEMVAKKQEWEEIKREVDAILHQNGQGRPASLNQSSLDASSNPSQACGALARGFASTVSVDSYASSSSSDCDSTPPTTPATSVWNHDGSRSGSSVSPLAHLSTLPACATLPFSQRAVYADLVSRLAALASRLSSIQKLVNMIEKEQGRRKWLESLEASRQVDKAMRRSWSNRASLKGCSGSEMTARPIRSSSLWQSHVENNEEEEHDSVLHSVMMDIDEDMSSSEEEEEEAMSDDDDVFSPHIKVRPISPIDVSSLFSSMPAVPALVPSSPAGSESDMDPLPSLLGRRRSSASSANGSSNSDPTSMDRHKNRRPSLETMDLSNYRIVSTSTIDSDETESNSILGDVASTKVLNIPPKAGEVGFRVGVAIVR